MHAGIDEHQPAAVNRRIADAAAGQLLQISGQHRHDDGDADNVEEEDDKDQKKAAANEFRVKHEASLQRSVLKRRSRRQESDIAQKGNRNNP
ncbi:hypothetical protein M2311_000498 [Rhizobium leguminosarum]|nr:hypothetical protein [Rhizobium leguminosarum]MDH6270437.1 hypothetical protein [Rhizobium leguminosarum]